jgi:hypothetical protein
MRRPGRCHDRGARLGDLVHGDLPSDVSLLTDRKRLRVMNGGIVHGTAPPPMLRYKRDRVAVAIADANG